MNDMNQNFGGRNQGDDSIKNNSDAKPAKPHRKGTMPRLNIPESFLLGGRPDHDAESAMHEQMILATARMRRALLSAPGITYVGIDVGGDGTTFLDVEAERTDGRPGALYYRLPILEDDRCELLLDRERLMD